MIKGNHMTPLTKQAVEREIHLLENNASDCHVRTETVAMLRALSAQCDALSEYSFEATKAIVGLTAGGSEFFAGKLPDGRYKADLPRCVKYVRDTKEALQGQVVNQYARGRLQGLHEAKAVAETKYEAPPKGIHGFQGDMHVAGLEISKAIEALKGETTND